MKISKGANSLIYTAKLSAQLALLAGSLLFNATLSAQPAPRMGISPDRYQIEFDESGGDTQSLLIQNLSDEPLSLSLSVSNWALNEANQITVVPPTESSLDQWIVINPLRVTIPPGSPQTVRWAVMPRLQPIDGEYRAIIFIEEDLPPQEKSEGTEVRMKMRYGLPIYAHKGDTVESAQLNGVAMSRIGDRLNLDLTNDGNTHARMSGNYGIWPTSEFPGSGEALKLLKNVNPDNQDSANFLVGTMPPSVVLPGDRRTIPVSLPIPDTGDYTIQLNAGFAQINITESLSFTRYLPEESEGIEATEDFRVASIPSSSPLIGSSE